MILAFWLGPLWRFKLAHPLGRADSTLFLSGFEDRGSSWTGEPRWSYTSRFGGSMSLGLGR
jgi:hypothetical protein